MRPLLIEFLLHIQSELAYILQHSEGITYEEFLKHPFTSKAFIRSFEVIGEACKNVPDEVRYHHPEFDWQGLQE